MSDLSYCSGNAVTLQSNSPNTGVNYGWTLNGTPIAGQNGNSVPVTGSGVYVVTITAGSCSANATANVTEVEQPSATLNNISQCDNATAPYWIRDILLLQATTPYSAGHLTAQVLEVTILH